MAEGDVNEDLLDYEEEEQAEVVGATGEAAKAGFHVCLISYPSLSEMIAIPPR
jgi:hypothetical protein